ncbi:hypothetical protein [Mucilaginibacter sp.]|uniref:hypothetical protein n=1 Tax=Mucilaginibacter sp. TaxID=1882438 RepID=UPI003262D540
MAKKHIPDFVFMIGLLIIIWLAGSNDEKNKKIEELSLALSASTGINDEIKKKLKELVAANPHIEADVAAELNDIHDLVDIQQDSKAILAMAKVIENLLKKIYRNDAAFKIKMLKRKPTFQDYLNYAHEQKLISNEDFHHISIIKIYRNEEAHELDVKKEKSKVFSSMMSGFSIISTLCGMIPGLAK